MSVCCTSGPVRVAFNYVPTDFPTYIPIDRIILFRVDGVIINCHPVIIENDAFMVGRAIFQYITHSGIFHCHLIIRKVAKNFV